MYNRKIRGPLIEGNKTLGQISEDVIAPMEKRPGAWWFIAFEFPHWLQYSDFMLFI